MVIPTKKDLPSITGTNFATTSCICPLDLLHYMHLYYVLGDIETANNIREWLMENDYLIHIDRDIKIVQMRNGTHSVVYRYRMDSVDMEIVSFVDGLKFKEPLN